MDGGGVLGLVTAADLTQASTCASLAHGAGTYGKIADRAISKITHHASHKLLLGIPHVLEGARICAQGGSQICAGHAIILPTLLRAGGRAMAKERVFNHVQAGAGAHPRMRVF